MHSGGISKWFGNVDKKMKTGTVNGAFWRYLKRYFGFGVNIWKTRTIPLFDTIFCLTCREMFKSNETKWCILTLFDTIFCPADKNESNESWMVNSDAFWDLCSATFRRIRYCKCKPGITDKYVHLWQYMHIENGVAAAVSVFCEYHIKDPVVSFSKKLYPYCLVLA